MIWRVTFLFISVFYSDKNSFQMKALGPDFFLNRSRNRSESLQGFISVSSPS